MELYQLRNVSTDQCIKQGMYQRNVSSNKHIEPGYQTYHEIIHGLHRNYIHTWRINSVISHIILRGVGRRGVNEPSRTEY